MSNDTRTDEELRAIVDAGEAARQELSRRAHLLAKSSNDRLRRLLDGDATAAFDAAELRYAAYTRCACGAGMAYPTEASLHGSWRCSAILRGTASRHVEHSRPMPFAFYEIKAEGQPSAYGATTRDKSDAAVSE